MGIGTDMTRPGDLTPDRVEYGIRDKGYARKLTDFGKVVYPEGMRSCADYPNLYPIFKKRGWSETRIEKFMGKNWTTYLGEVWRS